MEPMLTEIATALATKAVTGVYHDLVKAKFAKNRPAQAEIAAAVEERMTPGGSRRSPPCSPRPSAPTPSSARPCAPSGQ